MNKFFDILAFLLGKAAGGGGGDITVESKSISSNGTYTAPAGKAYSPVTVNVSGGGGSSYTLLAEQDFTVNTSSTTAVDVGTIEAGAGAYTSGKMLYVRVRDKAGKRPGYFLGTDAVFINANPANQSTAAISSPPGWTANYLENNTFKAGTTKYGVYAYQLYDDGRITISSRYSSSYGIVNGTYHVEVYLLDWPDGVSPFATS